MVPIPKFAGVIVDVRVSSVDRIFHYRIPPHCSSVEIGHRVLVPFGSRKLEGYVLELTDTVELPEGRLRDIIRIMDNQPVLRPEDIAVAKWMADTYVDTLAAALQCFLPVGRRYGEERVDKKRQLFAELVEPELLPKYRESLPKNATNQRRVLAVLEEEQRLLASVLVEKAGVSYQTLRVMEKKGWLRLTKGEVERKPEMETDKRQVFNLTPDQERALAQIEQEFSQGSRPILLHGVTGSGKTEIYLRLIEQVIREGKQVIVLVPEISLTSQTVARMRERFGESVAVLHSGLSEGERYDQWRKIFLGELSIVIGARSAVFAPTPRLGMFIIDEEHETTYKQSEGNPKYHAKEVALHRAMLFGAKVIFGSATPAVESYHRALRGEYCLVELPRRINNRPLPSVYMVDMRQEFLQGNRSMFSTSLSEALEEVVAKGEQAIILLNRRGYSSFVLCRQCGLVIECDNCHVSMTYHRTDDRLHCHYCNSGKELPKNCPSCGSPYFRQFGTGTQQVEAQIREKFPQVRPIRVDSDTTSRKGAHQILLRQFREGRANVMIGTQMIAKGLDFPNVTLVGVLSADLGLNFPDFRAAERTFQLLEQVAGRAGRDAKPGKVIIQCYDPNHYALQAVSSHDYLGFFRREIAFRREFSYPPFGKLIRLLISGPEAQVVEYCRQLQQFLQNHLVLEHVYGPNPAPISRIKGRYRWQALIKTQRNLNDLWRQLPPAKGDVQVSLDNDPLFFL